MHWVRRVGTAGSAVVLSATLCLIPHAFADDKTAAKEDTGKPWTFRAPQPATPASVKTTAWVRTPIDAFILAKLEAAGLRPAAEADRATLIRRLTFDLHGLPPTPAEVTAFVRDPAPDAYEKLVDRLLASPRYGERWALYWLDLVRYAESDGFKADDKRPAAWRYRDYVIQALNQDKPYDRFVREQLAGDELYPYDSQAQIATGLQRHVPYEYNAVNLEQRRQETLNDMTDTIGLVFLGLTIGCARCHDHKFDPITQEDYYRIQAFFAGTMPLDIPVDNRPEETERFRREMRDWETRTAGVRQQMRELEEPERLKFIAKRKGRFPKEYQDIYDIPVEKRTPLQQQIADLVEKQLEPTSTEISKAMKGETQQRWQQLNKQMSEFNRSRPPSPPSAMVLGEVGPVAPPTHLLKRGDWKHPEREIAPGYLSAIQDQLAEIPAPSLEARTTGRRSVLANWLTKPDHPLTARVQVNRLWQHHFGRGIVATTSDFGAQGDQATHPELLDWLAGQFVTSGWSMKTMHRLMVTSSVYRQAALASDKGLTVDPENRLLWHMTRRRLEGEALRDAMLAVNGSINLKEGGPSVYPELPDELGAGKGGWGVSSTAEANRRSIYVFLKRNLRYPLFGTFDAPDSNEVCARRHTTTTAPQALMLLNGQLALDMARTFAGRALREAGSDPERLVERAHELALGRKPAAQEKQVLVQFLQREATMLHERLSSKNPPARPLEGPAGVDAAFGSAVVDLCHALFNLNEFLYVE